MKSRFYIERCPYMKNEYYILSRSDFEVHGIIKKDADGWFVCHH